MGCLCGAHAVPIDCTWGTEGLLMSTHMGYPYVLTIGCPWAITRE